MNELICESESSTILKSLKSVQKKNEPCQVWQTIDGKRVLYNCLIEIIDQELNMMCVSPLEGEELFRFSRDVVIYCRFSSRGLLFKSDVLRKSNDLVSFSLPKEIILEESRGKERSTFGSFSSFHCDISFSETSLMNNGYKIFDLSPSGICLLVTDEEKEYFKVGSELFMSSIQGVRLTNKTSCKVCHIKKSSAIKNSVKHKVGIEFEPKLNQDDYLKVMEAII
ncbi:hypothetical protein A9Q84_10260 [Halobacteriovorax marinus]|uniref:PilZ domain-containing protein n=1 Tax=Halobacteriovorax marinus TaxID=97084 RepID=A0A1Y5F733_9BACT|nr:hypothetical protein A9Q84_10260 [Halobacteriovorax marinus]